MLIRRKFRLYGPTLYNLARTLCNGHALCRCTATTPSVFLPRNAYLDCDRRFAGDEPRLCHVHSPYLGNRRKTIAIWPSRKFQRAYRVSARGPCVRFFPSLSFPYLLIVHCFLRARNCPGCASLLLLLLVALAS